MTEPIYKIKTRAPSNIALIKYWGKAGEQLPINPSLSMTLSHAHTTTELVIEESSGGIQVEVFLDGEYNQAFGDRIEKYIDKLSNDYGLLKNKKYIVKTQNSFPHSSGIASSASGFAALALGLWSFLQSEGVAGLESASSLARRGSGSAARSFDGPYISWGDESLKDAKVEPSSSKLSLCDSIILVEKGQKSISSSAGHKLMDEHHFKEARIQKAKERFVLAKDYLLQNKWESLGSLIEQEALELHALMMTSSESFWLLSPMTLKIMNWIRKYRRAQFAVPVFFTLDAGANVHCLYPKEHSRRFQEDFKTAFTDLDVIHDKQGSGAYVIN